MIRSRMTLAFQFWRRSMRTFPRHLRACTILALSFGTHHACSELPEMPNVDDAERVNDTSTQARDGSPSSGPDANQTNTTDQGAVELDASFIDLGRTPDAGIAPDVNTDDGGQWMDADIMQPQPDASIPIPEPPTFDYIDRVIDLAVPNHNVWAHLIYVDREAFQPRFVETAIERRAPRSTFGRRAPSKCLPRPLPSRS